MLNEAHLVLEFIVHPHCTLQMGSSNKSSLSGNYLIPPWFIRLHD